MIIGIDTMVLIYAEMVPSKPGAKCTDFADLQERAKLLIYRAADRGDTIVLPTVVISELLVPVLASQRGAVVQVLEKNFQCPPLDIPAAVIAADIWSRFRNLPQGQGYSNARPVLRADAFVVASARTANATHFYSHDKDCRTLADLAGMKSLDLPVATELDEQYLLADIRSGTVPEPHKSVSRKKKTPKGQRRNTEAS